MINLEGKQIEAVLFDMDGTLVDSEKLWHIAERDLVRTRGSSVDEDLHETFTGVLTSELIKLVKQHYGFEENEETLLNELHSRVMDLLVDVDVQPGVEELLSFVKSHELKKAIVSNSAKKIIQASLTNIPWVSDFPYVFSADQVEHAKPAPDLYLLAADALAVAPENCLVIEDSLTGLRAGLAAGAVCFAVPEEPYKVEQFEALTPYVFASLVDVRTYLEKQV